MTEPVGPQYGLAPRLDHSPPPEQYYSKDLTNPLTYDDSSATEFGGVDGLIQPAPHVPTTSERLQMTYAIDPNDPGTGGPGSVAPPEFEGAFNSEY
jgi:hypothetical protein